MVGSLWVVGWKEAQIRQSAVDIEKSNWILN